MTRTITAMQPQYLSESLDMLEEAFTNWRDESEGRAVRALVEEMRRSPYYIPALELVMLEDSAVVGHVNFTRFPLEGKHEDRLLLLSPVSSKPGRQRQGISRALIEHGFAVARQLGYTAVLFEGDPKNYRARGFVTSAKHGITAAASVGLPHPDCLMVTALVPGGLDGITGVVNYDMYECLRGGNA